MECKNLNAALASMQLNNEAEALKAEGIELYRQNKYGDALRKYSKATEIDPNCPVYWNKLAVCYSELTMYTEAKAALQKCIEVDDKFIKGYVNLAHACKEMMEYEQAIQVLGEGLKVCPNNIGLVGLLDEIIEICEHRKLYHTEVLEVSDVKKKLDYYGGLPRSGMSRIPEGTTYSRLERTALPKLAKKMKKYSEEVKPLVEQFAMKSLKIAWFASDKEVALEGYMDGDDVPVITLRVYFYSDEDCMGVIFHKHYEQNQKWHRILTLDEKDSLLVLLNQRFLREKGCSIHGPFLSSWIHALVDHCMAKALYKHAADLALIHADIVFNQNLDNEVRWTEVRVLRQLANSLVMTKDRSSAGGVYSDIMEPQRFGIKVDPYLSKDGAFVYSAICAHVMAFDCIKAEALGVSALRKVGTHNWDWNALRHVMQTGDVANGPMSAMAHVFAIYQQNYHAISCRLKTSEKDYKLLKVYVLLEILLSCAGCPTWFMDLMSEETNGNLPCIFLKQKFRNQKRARRAIIQAFMMPTIDEYHACVLDCQTTNCTNESCFLLMEESGTCAGDIGDRQANFWEKQKASIQNHKDIYFPGDKVVSNECPGCTNPFAEEKMKECPCKMVMYCSKRCQDLDWSNHRVLCPFYKKNKPNQE